MFFDGGQPVLGPQKFGGDERRTRIGVFPGLSHKLKIAIQRLGSAKTPQPFNAVR